MEESKYKASIQLLKKQITELENEKKQMRKDYAELLKRYTNQNDELLRLKIELSEEGYYDNIRSKQRN